MPDELRRPGLAPRRSGNVQAEELGIEGPLLISVRRFADARGSFSETYSRRDFAAIGIPDEFVQDNQSFSAATGTLRGLHFQAPPTTQGKLVRVLRGRILDVAVDLRRGSPTYLRHVSAELSAENGLMLWVPVGFAHGFVTREPDTEVAYKCTGFYDTACDRGIAWNDPDIAVDWGVTADQVVLSDKDRRAPVLAEIGSPF
jgi:dTDP-4-dehydrorhamnose 3,5-epimerase